MLAGYMKTALDSLTVDFQYSAMTTCGSGLETLVEARKMEMSRAVADARPTAEVRNTKELVPLGLHDHSSLPKPTLNE